MKPLTWLPESTFTQVYMFVIPAILTFLYWCVGGNTLSTIFFGIGVFFFGQSRMAGGRVEGMERMYFLCTGKELEETK